MATAPTSEPAEAVSTTKRGNKITRLPEALLAKIFLCLDALTLGRCLQVDKTMGKCLWKMALTRSSLGRQPSTQIVPSDALKVIHHIASKHGTTSDGTSALASLQFVTRDGDRPRLLGFAFEHRVSLKTGWRLRPLRCDPVECTAGGCTNAVGCCELDTQAGRSRCGLEDDCGERWCASCLEAELDSDGEFVDTENCDYCDRRAAVCHGELSDFTPERDGTTEHINRVCYSCDEREIGTCENCDNRTMNAPLCTVCEEEAETVGARGLGGRPAKRGRY